MVGLMRWMVPAFLLAFAAFASASPAAAQDPKCADLLPIAPEGAGLPVELADTYCVEQDRFAAAGRQFLVADVAGFDPEGAALRVGAVREAIERAAALYAEVLSVPDTLVIFGSFPSLDLLSPGGGSVLAVTLGDAESCVIIMEKSAIHTGRDGVDRNDLMRTVAHELFHCVQRTDDGLDNAYWPWRDEGTAEYFASLAIPEAAFNPVYGGGLPRLIEVPLDELDESAAPFFYYLGRERGRGAVVAFLQASSRDHSPEGAVASLRAIPGVDVLFHDFARDWLNGFLTDVDGTQLDLPVPSFAEAPLVAAAQELDLGAVYPFMVAARRYVFARGMAWEISAPADADALGGFRYADDGEWSTLPATIDVCEERDGVILVTLAADSIELREQKVTVSERRDRNPCACPLGTWSIGAEALRGTPAARMMPGDLLGGSISLAFGADGTAQATYHALTFESPIDPTSSIRTILNGTIGWTWRRSPWDERLGGGPAPTGVDDAMMIERTTTTVSAAWTVQFWGRDGMISERTRPFRPDGGSVSLMPAICEGETLRLAPNAATPFDAGPPWTGTFARGG